MALVTGGILAVDGTAHADAGPFIDSIQISLGFDAPNTSGGASSYVSPNSQDYVPAVSWQWPLVLTTGSPALQVQTSVNVSNLPTDGTQYPPITCTTSFVSPLDGSNAGVQTTDTLNPNPGLPMAYAWVVGQIGGSAWDALVAKPGVVDLTFTVDCGDLGSKVLPLAMRVLPAPPYDQPGVSINDGADSTNQAAVRIFPSWIGLVDRVEMSNDGGFAPSRTKSFPLTGSPIDWQLSNPSDQILPKTVYVRYHQVSNAEQADFAPNVTPILDGAWSTTTFTDDIVLDTVAPSISGSIENNSVAARPFVAMSGAFEAASTSAVLRLHAVDNRTGVARMQVSSLVPNSRVPQQPYRATVAVSATTQQYCVRVRDGAGNWSAWHRFINPRTTTLGLTAPTHAAPNAWFTVTATLRRANGAKAGSGLPLVVWVRAHGTTRWTKVSTAWTRLGVVRFGLHHRRSEQVKVTYAGSCSLLASSSPIRSIRIP